MMPHERDAVRLPAFAGTFYPASQVELEAQLARFLADASRGRVARVPPHGKGCPKALIVPHAGYIYSGPVAASAYAELLPHASQITRVILIGPAHRVRVDGVVSSDAARLRTPLGDVEVDTEALAQAAVSPSAAAHAHEHSLEVQLPFLQKVVPHAKVIALAVGSGRAGEVARVLSALWGGPETVIVVSSDLSHYLPYDVGREADLCTAARIVELDPSELRGDEACGAAAINGLLTVARAKGLHAELLDLRSSGDTAGSRDEVVGYGAFAFRERES